MSAVDLLFYLDEIASISEDDSLIRQHGRDAAGAREAGEPFEALRAIGDKLALIFISQWHDESVELLGCYGGAQGGEFFGRGQHDCNIGGF
jgi:hypothetical protein